MAVIFKEQAAPSTPATNYVSMYAKSDGLMYYKDDAGTEYSLTAPSDTAYGAGWNGVTGIAPSKNAVYDKIEAVVATIVSTFSDSAFRVQDNGDATKQIALEASGITTGTTRTVTMPDRNVDLGKATLVRLVIACSDETTSLTTGTAKVTFRMPCALTLTAVRASVTTAPTGSVLTVDINESGSTILSTKLTIDASEKTSTTAATPAVISDTSLADDAEMTIDIDGVGSTIPGAGLKVYLIGYET